VSDSSQGERESEQGQESYNPHRTCDEAVPVRICLSPELLTLRLCDYIYLVEKKGACVYYRSLR
jgi:hypothetical protein